VFFDQKKKPTQKYLLIIHWNSNYHRSRLMSQINAPVKGEDRVREQNKTIFKKEKPNLFHSLFHSLLNLWSHDTASAPWEQSYVFTSVTSLESDHAVTR